MKLIWIATTSVLFVSLFVNAAEISTHHETDFLETDADSVLNSLQADDHDHRIEKRSGSRPVPGYSEKKGDCGGHDISNVKASLQQCAAKCSRMAQCKGFLYIHQAQNYRWHRCWLKRRLCSRPRHPRGQVVSVYTKGGKSGGGPRRVAAKKVPVSGYTERSGDCRGKNIANIKGSPQVCAANCGKIRECAGFLYIHQASNYRYHRCWLKRALCSRPFHPPGQHVSVYTKKKEARAEKKASLDRYREVLGHCEGNNLHQFMARHWECAEQCSLRSECAGWAYVLKDTNRVWKGPQCLLKKVMCVKPVITAGLLIKSYYKNGVTHPTEAPATVAPPVVAPEDEELDNENDVPTEEDATFNNDDEESPEAVGEGGNEEEYEGEDGDYEDYGDY